MTNIASALVSAYQARDNCKRSGNTEWLARWESRIAQLADTAPSGSGLDNGTRIVHVDASTIRLETAFHHMNGVGYYDGWTEHPITVRPSFGGGLHITIRGRDRNNIKDYIHDVMSEWLGSEAPAAPWVSSKATATAP